MRPGKAQTFGIVEGTPVFGLPGNPAAAYVGFQMLIRPALRTMQGYRFMDHPVVKARLTADEKNRDPRRIYLRANLTRTAEGYEVTPAKNQSCLLYTSILTCICRERARRSALRWGECARVCGRAPTSRYSRSTILRCPAISM